MSSHTEISKKRRFEVFERDGFRCRYCGRSSNEVALEIDHIVPTEHGGTNEKSNLVTSCRGCNLGKNDRMSDSYFRHFLKQELDCDGDFVINLRFDEGEYEMLLKVRNYIVNNSHDNNMTVSDVLHRMVMQSLGSINGFLDCLEEK